MMRVLAISLLVSGVATAAAGQTVSVPLEADGTVPVWLVAGPFDQPTTGFGVPADVEIIDETALRPVEGAVEESGWAEGGRVAWRPVAPSPAGFVDFHAAFADVRPGGGPERVWWAKVGYAYTAIRAERAGEAILLLGSNSHAKVLLNGEVVHTAFRERNARRDADTVVVRLRTGVNHLVVRVGQTHRNEGLQFFEPLEWQWGFYARLVSAGGRPLEAAAEIETLPEETPPELRSTFFFRETDERLEQRFDLSLVRRAPTTVAGEVHVTVGGAANTVSRIDVPFGVSHHPVWLPAVEAEMPAVVEVRLAGEATVTREVVLEPRPRYELHLMLTSHMDVGYTHPQPTVAERHAILLDEVVRRAEAEPDFRWTIETVWQLEQFVEHRSPEQVERLMRLVREGRVAVSPIYANPFTGWVSEEELIRSFSRAADYADRFGIGFGAALFNDEPGFSWMLPAALGQKGVRLFVAGLNEVYSDYSFQRALPKVFRWQGAGGASVVTYLTEAYNEGQTYGLIKGVRGTEDRMRERLLRLEAGGYDYDMVLLNTTLGDNGGIPLAELAGAREWNAHYAYPRIVVSTLDYFADAFLARHGEGLPTISGDWTSTWSVLYQGELARTVRQRWAQHQLGLAEAISTAAWLADGREPLDGLIQDAYRSLQHYSAHGSGLEFGYGSPRDNAVTMAYREQYVQAAVLTTEEVIQRATRRLMHPLEAFDGQGLFVFNGLETSRDVPIEVEFPRESPARYRVVDPVDGRELPSHQEGYTLRFVGRDLPAVGYRKLRLEPRPEASPATDLRVGETAIENAYYRVEVDPASGSLSSLVERRTGRELVRTDAALPFGAPVLARFGDPEGFAPHAPEVVSLTVLDERPARVRLVVGYPGEVVASVAYTLWEGLDRLEVEASVDLEVLEPVEVTEEYGLAFPFALPSPEVRLGILGGFADPDADRLPGAGHDAFALRQSLALTDERGSLSWAAVDSRVVRLRAVGEERDPTLVAILANHFPESWNRHEENVGVWPLRFALTYRDGPFDPAFTDAFGRDVAHEVVARPTWLADGEPVRSFIELDGEPVHLLAFQSTDAGVLVRLRNPRGDVPASARITLPGRVIARAEVEPLAGGDAASIRLDGTGVAVTIEPNAITTLRLGFAGERAGGTDATPHQPPQR